MKNLKIVVLFVIVFAAFFFLTGCGNDDNKDKTEENKTEENKTEENKTEENKTEETPDKNIDGSLEDLMTKIYEEIPEEERPMMLMNTEIDSENVEYYLGTADIEYEEALASEPGVGSIAHSVVLVRVKENADIESIKTKIKNNVNPRKWICVEAEEVVVASRGNLIVLIMASSNVDKLKTGFNKL